MPREPAPATQSAIDRILQAWIPVRQDLQDEGVVPADVDAHCILAASSAVTVLRERYGLKATGVSCDLAVKSAEGEYELVVEHPEASSAIGVDDRYEQDVYFGHVVAVVEDETGAYLIDPELRVVAPVGASGHVFATTAEGVAVLLSMRTEHDEFATTAAWDAGPAVAKRIVAVINNLDGGAGDQAG